MQVLLRNPLADPYVLGISGGAGVGAVDRHRVDHDIGRIVAGRIDAVVIRYSPIVMDAAVNEFRALI